MEDLLARLGRVEASVGVTDFARMTGAAGGPAEAEAAVAPPASADAADAAAENAALRKQVAHLQFRCTVLKRSLEEAEGQRDTLLAGGSVDTDAGRRAEANAIQEAERRRAAGGIPTHIAFPSLPVDVDDVTVTSG